MIPLEELRRDAEELCAQGCERLGDFAPLFLVVGIGDDAVLSHPMSLEEYRGANAATGARVPALDAPREGYSHVLLCPGGGRWELAELHHASGKVRRLLQAVPRACGGEA